MISKRYNFFLNSKPFQSYSILVKIIWLIFFKKLPLYIVNFKKWGYHFIEKEIPISLFSKDKVISSLGNRHFYLVLLASYWMNLWRGLFLAILEAVFWALLSQDPIIVWTWNLHHWYSHVLAGHLWRHLWRHVNKE